MCDVKADKYKNYKSNNTKSFVGQAKISYVNIIIYKYNKSGQDSKGGIVPVKSLLLRYSISIFAKLLKSGIVHISKTH